MKKHFIGLFIGAALMSTLLAAASFSASAATPEEAEAVARSMGVSEENIQAAWNRYYEDPDAYPPEIIDDMIEDLVAAKDKIVTTAAYNPGAVVPALTQTTAAIQSDGGQETNGSEAAVTTAAGTAGSGNTGSGNTGGNTGSDNSGGNTDNGEITLTASDGTAFTRVSRAAFIALSYDDKITYLSSFTPVQQEAFIADLSPEEYKSMMKQLPVDQKADVLDTLSGITDGLGLNMTVDSLTDNDVKISLRDENGELKAVAEAGKLVEDTGYDRRGLLAVCGGLLMLVFGGLAVMLTKCFGAEENADE